MIRDLNYSNTSNHHTIAVTTDQSTPDVLKRAITLMLFSTDDEIRNFNDSSVVNAFPSLTESSLEGIQHYLALAASRIKMLLQEAEPDVDDVYFECINGNGGSLQVTLNVTMAGTTQTTVVYSD